MIEVAKSGRASCRTCRTNIAKGELRFGEEVPSQYGEPGTTTFLWHHLLCAAKKKPGQLRESLEKFTGDVSNRAEVDKLISENEPKQKPHHFPYVERAATGRSRCASCRETIDKDQLRVATEREAEAVMSGMGQPAPRYWHLKCAVEKAEIDDIVPKLLAHSKGLTPEDVAAIEAAGKAGA